MLGLVLLKLLVFLLQTAQVDSQLPHLLEMILLVLNILHLQFTNNFLQLLFFQKRVLLLFALLLTLAADYYSQFLHHLMGIHLGHFIHW